MTYTYDGDGNRIEKSSGKIYWYGAGTEILDESDTSGNITEEYVFFGGKRVAMRDVSSGNIYYYAADMLGSARTQRGLPGRRRVEPGGSVQAGQTAVCYDADFLPYGQEVDYTSTRKGSQVPGKGSLGDRSNYKFEGKERDTETGNDNFGARYYRSALGRWLSAAERAPRSPVRGAWEIGTRSGSGSAIPVPVPYANLTNPQTLNLYAMVSDNPETFADLDGHCSMDQENCNTTPSIGTNNPASSNKNVCNSETGKCDHANTNVNGHDKDPVQQQNNQDQNQKKQPVQMSGGKGGGQRPKGERRFTGKPEYKGKPGKLPKGWRWDPAKQQYWHKNPQTGKPEYKPSGWSPTTAQKVGVGATIVTGAVILGRAIAGCFESGVCEAAIP